MSSANNESFTSSFPIWIPFISFSADCCGQNFQNYLSGSGESGHPKLSNINLMKSQRNTQQVKEQDECPPNQTKKEDIGNLHDKEFQIMIVKMIQNLEIKMESQINNLETRIENMKERFN